MNGGTAGNVHVRGNRTHTQHTHSIPTAASAAASEGAHALPPAFLIADNDRDTDKDRPEKKYRRLRRRRPYEWLLIALALAVSVTILWRLFQLHQQDVGLALVSSAQTEKIHKYTDMPTPGSTHNRPDAFVATQQRLGTKAEKEESLKTVQIPSTIPGKRNNNIDGNKKQTKHFECGLYIAESTIPNAGLGVFTAAAKKPLDPLGSGDVCIPNIDINYHNPLPVFNPFQTYYWKGSSMGMSRESHSNDVEAFCPGLDSAVNCNLALINTHKSYPLYDTAQLHRSRDPGTGAFTPYHNGTTYAARHIPAGGELFKFYGNGWFTSRPHLFDGNFPLHGDFEQAEDLLRNMTALHLSDAMQKDLYESIVVGRFKKAFTSRILGALPLTIEDAVIGAAQDLAVLHQPAAIRSIDWLQQHGRCIDNIAPAYSSIRQAGHGAVATRALQQGQIITTSPLHHLPLRTFVEMYNFEWTLNLKGKPIRQAVSESGQQLLINYCFGHHESSLVLCPYGNGVNYINHQSHSRANVAIRWATGNSFMHNTTQVERGRVDDLMWNYQPQLALDYVALRDIAPGEELFLDYGDRFDEAWQRHTAQYRIRPSTPDAERYVDGFSMNIRNASDPVRTEEEQKSHPYPDHIQVRAHQLLQQRRETTPESENGRYTWGITHYGLPAKILERFVNGDGRAQQHSYYTVQIGIVSQAAASDMRTRDREANVTWVRRENVPRSALSFFDKPGRTDMHLPNAFRHVIGIPDDIFPEQWKNREQLETMMNEKSLAMGDKT
jgi:hypothetical protein